MFMRNTLHYFLEKYTYKQEINLGMPELSNQEIFDNEGHINYDKVVDIVHLNLKNFLDSILNESFTLAMDGGYRAQISNTSSKIRDQALDSFSASKHVVSSEFYVELETRFYTSSSAIIRSNLIDPNDTHSMDTDLIELALAMDQLIERSVNRHADLIEQLTLQLEELSFISHQEFNANCLQPQDFYKLFQNCIAPLAIPADGKILISKLLYENVSPNLNDFYLAMHNFLLGVDIKPNSATTISGKDQNDFDHTSENSSYDSSIMSMTTGQFFAPVEQEMWQKEYDSQNDYVEKQLSHTPEIIDEVAMDVYGPGQAGLDETTVSLLLQPYRPNSQSNSSPAQRRQFIRALSSVQRVEAASNAIFQAQQIKTAARRTLHEKGALDAAEIVANEEKLIDFVSNIFQLILKDESICDAVKNILAKLQISTIKLALIDFTFFQNTKHPARQLLNKLTSIGISVSGTEEKLFSKLDSIVRNITDSFETDIQVFELALSEIQQLDPDSLEQQITKEDRERQKHKLRSQRSAAKRVVLHTIKKFTKNKEIPNQVLEYCLKCWAPHMAYIYMNHGRTTKKWRNSVRTLRRTIEVSQGIHSLQEVSQYIHHPSEFFDKIRVDLEYFTDRNSEFEEALEEAEVWYLTYLRKIELEDEAELEHSSEQEAETSTDDEQQDNVIHLFKNLSPTHETDDTKDLTKPSEIEEETKIDVTEKVTTVEDSQHKVVTLQSEDTLETNEDHALEGVHEFASELDSEAEFDESDLDEDPEPEELELNVTEHLPESIVPGAWLEIYQGEDKAKRRLKFTKAITETNYLVFSDRSGDYSLEIDLQTFLDDLSTGKSSLISESNRFDLALSSVISNIRTSQDNAK